MNRKLQIIAILILGCLGSVANAQDYDDIYYDSTKKTSKPTVVSTPTSSTTASPSYSYYDNSYSTSGSTIINGRDVDEYNLRGDYGAEEYVPTDSIAVIDQGELYEDYAYTTRIRKFYNPTIIVETTVPTYYDPLYAPALATAAIATALSPWYWSDYYYWNSWRPYYSYYGWHNPWYYSWN